MITVTKTWKDLPAAHRQHAHDGHCRFIHGHNWRIDITFGCNFLDECGFVMDVGKMGVVRDFLGQSFDHTLILNSNDPELQFLKQNLSYGGNDEEGRPFAQIVTVPNCGMEGLAKWIFEEVQAMLLCIPGAKDRGLLVVEVTVWEDSKNRATYTPE